MCIYQSRADRNFQSILTITGNDDKYTDTANSSYNHNANNVSYAPPPRPSHHLLLLLLLKRLGGSFLLRVWLHDWCLVLGLYHTHL